MPPCQEPHVLLQIIVLDFSVSAHKNEDHAVQFDCCSIYNVESLSPVPLPSLSGKAGKVFKLRGSFRWILLSFTQLSAIISWQVQALRLLPEEHGHSDLDLP